MKYKDLSNKELAQALKACSSKKGDRCSQCPLLGHGDYNCRIHIEQEASRRLLEIYEETNNKNV